MESYKLFGRKKINNLNEIYNGKKLLTKEFINLDLSNLDLSTIPITEWEDCIFYNTNFQNTGIKFIPNKLAKTIVKNAKNMDLQPFKVDGIYMNYCDFSNNDLTFLTPNDFYQSGNNEVKTYGCIFTNTGINFLKTLVNIKLDSSYQEYKFDDDFWKFEYGSINFPFFIDINTIIKNPNLRIPSFRIMKAIEKYLFDDYRKQSFPSTLKRDNNGNIRWGFHNGNIEYKANMVKQCEDFLKYDKQGYGKNLYEKLKPFMSTEERFEFFMFSIQYLDIKNIDFEDIPAELLRFYTIQNNNFTNIIFNNTLEDLLKLWGGSEHFLDNVKGHENHYNNVYFPNITYSSWQNNPTAKKRISESAFTFFNKVYLELSRTCNANCPFCRNSTFNESEYNLTNIIKTLKEIKSYINAVVIGGGEPTLRLEDVKKLHKCFIESKIDWHLFSNGTNPSFVEDDYVMDNFKLNLSRHAVNDQDNANIFRIDSKKIMTSNDLEKLNIRNEHVTLYAVCFRGGLDSFDKIINYINFSRNVGCKKVLLQDLQKEISLGNNIIQNNNLCINQNIFSMVREYLKINGYREKYPIYATGGYVSYILTNKEGFSVTLQSYINQQELDREWIKSIKRTFDLSIDPSGNLYENWNQKTGLVKKIK